MATGAISRRQFRYYSSYWRPDKIRGRTEAQCLPCESSYRRSTSYATLYRTENARINKGVAIARQLPVLRRKKKKSVLPLFFTYPTRKPTSLFAAKDYRAYGLRLCFNLPRRCRNLNVKVSRPNLFPSVYL